MSRKVKFLLLAEERKSVADSSSMGLFSHASLHARSMLVFRTWVASYNNVGNRIHKGYGHGYEDRPAGILLKVLKNISTLLARKNPCFPAQKKLFYRQGHSLIGVATKTMEYLAGPFFCRQL